MRLILQLLKDNGLHAKMSKCEFFRMEIDFLGHRISGAGIHTSPAELTAVSNWPVCQCVKDVQAFLGLANYYRRFVPNFSSIAKPLTDLLRSDVPFRWDMPQQEAFEQLKSARISAPILALPDQFKGFVITTDASSFAIGAVLSQETPDGLRPIAYESKKLMGAELNWPVHDRELFSIVHAVKAWGHYLADKHTVIYTDHNALKLLETQRDRSPRQIKWHDTLSRHHLNIRYKPGAENDAVDALSRRPDHAIASAVTQVTTRIVPDPTLLAQIREGYDRAAFWRGMQSSDASAFECLDGLWWCKPGFKPTTHPVTRSAASSSSANAGRRLCNPDHGNLRASILAEHHDVPLAGHLGVKKTLSSLQQTFYWPDMTQTGHPVRTLLRRLPAEQGLEAGHRWSLPVSSCPSAALAIGQS